MQLIMRTYNGQKEHCTLLDNSSYNTVCHCIADWLCNKDSFTFDEKEYQELIENGYCFLPSMECEYFNQCDKKDDNIKFCQANNKICIELRQSVEEGDSK